MSYSCSMTPFAKVYETRGPDQAVEPTFASGLRPPTGRRSLEPTLRRHRGVR